MGELHLDVLVTRIIDDFGVKAKVGKPQVTYRESIGKAVTHTEKFHRIIAGKENTADITLKVEPLPRGTGNSFDWQLKKDQLPGGPHRSGKTGRHRGFSSGALYGYPAIDIGVTLTDAGLQPADFHPVRLRGGGFHGLRRGLQESGSDICSNRS